MTGQPKVASLKTLTIAHRLRRKAAQTTFFSKKIPPRYKPQKDQRIVGIILSYIGWGTSGPLPQTSSVSLSRVPVT